MKNNLEFEEKIRQTLQQYAEQIEPSENLLGRVKTQADQYEKKERKAMKLFTPKKLVVAAILCVASVSCYAAIQLGGVESHSNISCDSYADLGKEEEKAGFDIKSVETFSNGFTFRDAGTGFTNATDTEGNPTGEQYALLSIGYEKDGKNAVLTAEDGNIYADAGQETPEGYSAQVYKFVPPDYTVTEEDKQREAAGEIVISYGSEEVEENVVEDYFWEDDGLYYSLTAFDADLGEAGMQQMVEEIMAGE